ncbi:DUF4279 domain-containing protein [Luteolibacter ambystomatis]
MIRVSGDYDPAEVSRVVAVDPELSYRKGDEYVTKDGRTLRRPNSHWSVSTKDLDSRSMECHFLELRKRLGGVSRWEKIRQMDGVVVSIAVWWEAKGGFGDYFVTSKALSSLAGYGDDFEFYFL